MPAVGVETQDPLAGRVQDESVLAAQPFEGLLDLPTFRHVLPRVQGTLNLAVSVPEDRVVPGDLPGLSGPGDDGVLSMLRRLKHPGHRLPEDTGHTPPFLGGNTCSEPSAPSREPEGKNSPGGANTPST